MSDVYSIYNLELTSVISCPRYRNPAKAPALPGHSKSVYDNNFANYGIDTHRRADTTPYFMTKSNMKLLEANKHNMPDQDLPNYAGSPGRKNADVNRYDPTGLRSSMTASWAELEKKYDENMPDHLPLPHWYLDQAAIVEKYESRGLPPVPGEEWKPKNETTDPETGIPRRHSNLW